MRKLVLIATVFFNAALFAQNCSELFISEYAEGWSNNKALEIYNPTANPINLSNYFLVRYSNGSTSPTSQNMVQLSGTVPPYDVFVAVLDKRDTAGTGQNAPIWDSLLIRADGFFCADYNISNPMYFNGNDALALFKGNMGNFSNAVAVDIFGKIGEDPGTESGWTDQSPYVGVGTAITVDHSLIRHQNIEKGVINPMITEFNAMIEWDTLPAVVNRLDSAGNIIYGQSGNPVVDGNWFSLGWHACDCSPYLSVPKKSQSITSLKVFPNPSNGEVNIIPAVDVENLTISNNLGQIILEKESLSAMTLTQISLDKSGFYFISILAKDGSKSTQRFVIK